MNNEDIAVKLAEHQKEIGSLKHRMDAADRVMSEQNKLIRSVDKLATNMEYMATEQKKQGDRLERLERAPVEESKDYKKAIVTAVVTTVVGAVLGAILALILK